MNYEQKYKEALSQAKKELEACGSLDCDAARQIFRLFPELEEIEESKIIDALKVAVLLHCSPDHNYVNTIPKSHLIYWLEKQGEQKQEWSSKDEDIFTNLWGMLRNNYVPPKNAEEYIKWLQSLKQRLNGYG